jgi:protein-disulfide isomerase
MDKLAADVDEARQGGLSGTPTFFVGQAQVVGAKPCSEFKTVIEDELARPGETREAE